MPFMHDLDDIDDELELMETPDGTGTYKSSRYTFVEFDTPLDAEAALYACRMLRCDRMYRRIFERKPYVDHGVLALLGITDNVDPEREQVIPSVRAAVSRQRARLEARAHNALDLDAGIATLGDALHFDDAERCILRLAVVVTCVEGFSHLFAVARLHKDYRAEIIGRAVGISGSAVRKALRTGSTLCSGAFFQERRPLVADERNPLVLNSAVGSALSTSGFDVETFLRHLVRTGAKPRLVLDDYSHIPDVDMVQRYLAGTAKHQGHGINILLYGAPGTGKTEFVRALACALHLKLYEVPNEDDDGDPVTGQQRFSAYALCQKLLAERSNQLILFDEVEDVFGGWSGPPMWLFDSYHGERRLSKSWTNEVLETNPVPTMWVCNAINAMDHAFLRRFDMTVEFRAPGAAATRRLVNRYFNPGEISASCVEKLAAIEQLPPARIERAARVTRILGSDDVQSRDVEVLRLVDASLRAIGRPRAMANVALPTHYDPAFANADRDLGALIEGLKRGSGARLCFYGPPGTGKTAFGHYLATALGARLHVKRASDLLGPYVGMTEELIADAFRGAADERAILLIDEADSFLHDRTGAKQSWEVSQVNELLTQMESFEGIFIASTNLVDTLDAASLRRFDFKVKFDYLKPAQRRALLAKVCNIDPEAIDSASASLLGHMELLTPGDFANVLRQFHITGETVTPEGALHRLAAEVALKPEGRRRPIGFAS